MQEQREGGSMGNNFHASIGSHLAEIAADAQALSRIAAATGETSASLPKNASGFGAYMVGALRSVNEQDRLAAAKMDDVDAGRSDDLVGAMLASQEASLSFSMLMQVRNKIVAAVDELIKLPL